ncbi:MAG: type VI secretion system baseplate subunit TssG [Candidatus Zixiibacteriota bacterium]|nr:MAG: type VI secretion system baseplate subunit TssG [candidate division Zixibacteria bacterium]
MSAAKAKVMPDLTNRRAPFHFATALNTLVKMGVELDRVDILAVGEYSNYKGEILSQEPAAGEALGPTTRVTLNVGFPSAVDSMPYQFFYGLHGITPSTGAWEDAARNLMAPFDAAVIRHYALAKLRDLQSNLGLAEIADLRRFLELFDFSLEDHASDVREAVVWASVFPAFSDWSGNPTLVCRVLRALFGYEFRIRENTPSRHEIPKSCRATLAGASDRLGKGLVLGKSFTDYDSGYEVIISGVSVEDVPELLPGGKKRTKIEKALSIFMPNNLEHRIRVKTRKSKVAIGRKEQRNYLGYTSYIGA